MHKWHIFLLSLFISSPMLAQNAAPLSSDCVIPNSTANTLLDKSLGYAEAIQTYLSAGGDPAQLKPLLQAAGVLPDPSMSDGVYVTDLTGDGINDVIVNIFYPDTLPIENNFVIWIYVCNENEYQQVYEDAFPQTSTALDPGMFIASIQDLNNDSRPEVIYHATHCGMYCFMELYIAGWNSTTQPIHQMLWYSFQVGDYSFTDADGDGIFDVVITSGNGGSAGSGPLRKWQTTFGWDGINFSQRRSVPESPQYGFQAAEDAARALHTGDFQTAAILYQRILNDPTFTVIDERTDSITKSQALFDLLIIRMFQRDYQTADQIYAELQNFPAIEDINKNLSESLWVQVGRIFYQEADHKYDLSGACDAVIAELNIALESERQSPGTDNTYWGHFGMRPQPEDICPF